MHNNVQQTHKHTQTDLIYSTTRHLYTHTHTHTHNWSWSAYMTHDGSTHTSI